ncbi:DoxX family membrane protein [Streptomyces sp. NPDC012616]|uniref:DoxX family protein n=1 Tax=Streptomyces sp. NPDC012616 TaxID=3364840 RepID=UPI0036EFBC54
MAIVSLPPVQRLRPLAPLVVRVAAGVTLIAHGFEYSPAEFGRLVREAFGVPFSGPIGWAAVLLQVVGGGMFVLGLLSRIVAIPAIVHMALALSWEAQFGLAPENTAESIGAQVPLLIMAGFIVVLLAGPGPVSLDRLIGWDNGWDQGSQPVRTDEVVAP